MKKERNYASALEAAESRISKTEIENNSTLNTTLVFMSKSPNYPAFKALQQHVVEILKQDERSPLSSGPKRSEASLRNVETLLANLIVMQEKGKDTLAVSLSPNFYATTNLTAGMIDLYKVMHEMKLLTLSKGFKVGSRSQLSRIRPRRNLRKLLTGIGSDSIYSEPTELISLRARRKQGERVGKIIHRKDWPSPDKPTSRKLDKLRLCLEWFNLVLNESEIDYDNGAKRLPLYPVLYASFTEDFEHGGRFYTGRGGHTNLSKEERATIHIGGKSTVELDFGGLHIRMLYHLNRSAFPLSADPYAEVLAALGKQPDRIFQRFDGIRADLKETLLALINDDANEGEAIARAQWRLFNKWTDEDDSEKRAEAKREAGTRERNWEAAGLTVKKVIRGFQDAHRPIAHEFSSGRGLELQNIDAEIARRVLDHMMTNNGERCVPTLPIHDSFITVGDSKGILADAMRSSYRSVMRERTDSAKDFQIPIKGP